MTQISQSLKDKPVASGGRDIGFAAAIAAIISIFFLPIPSILIDLGLAFSIALSVVILMVALWIQRPIDFSAFPVVLLVATLLRLSLNIATTRLILSHGPEGVTAAGYIIGGFSRLLMSGDFVIGLIVFAIIITVNFLVITKGASRIAEVGARFTLDAIPGKQMAIDADLSSGMIDEREARLRRRELEEESAFFGSMDGASKFVRGDAIAGIIILVVNIFGGIVIGVTRHNMALGAAADVFTKLSVGDGLVSQIPALIVSLAAGLLVSKGGTRGSAEKAVIDQLVNYPRALYAASILMMMFALVPGLPFLPFGTLAGILAFVAYTVPRRQALAQADEEKIRQEAQTKEQAGSRESLNAHLRTPDIELCLGKQLALQVLPQRADIASRMTKMRKKFAKTYGFVIPEIALTDSITLPAKSYEIRIHGTMVSQQSMRIGELLVLIGDRPKPDIAGDMTRDPAFGMQAMWVPPALKGELRRQNFEGVDNTSVILTHLSELIRQNLSRLFSYKDLRNLIDQLEPEYRRLVDDIIPTHISYSGLQAVIKLLLAERVSIRNFPLLLEAIAEIAPHVRRSEQIVEHVRMRMAAQLCGDLVDGGVLKILRLGNRWDLAFRQSLKRDNRGDIVEFDLDPRLVEQFSQEASTVIRQKMDQGDAFVLVTAADARPYVRMIIERLFPNLSVLSQLEIARGITTQMLGTIS